VSTLLAVSIGAIFVCAVSGFSHCGVAATAGCDLTIILCDLCGSAVSLFEPMIHRRRTPRGHGAELKSGHYPGKAALTTANLLCKLTQLTTIIMHRAGRLPQRRHY